MCLGNNCQAYILTVVLKKVVKLDGFWKNGPSQDMDIEVTLSLSNTLSYDFKLKWLSFGILLNFESGHRIAEGYTKTSFGKCLELP